MSKVIRGGTVVTAERMWKADVLIEGERVAPTAMVMCPCVDGLSHNEAEEITPHWAEKGANVLFHAVVGTAGIVG